MICTLNSTLFSSSVQFMTSSADPVTEVAIVSIGTLCLTIARPV